MSLRIRLLELRATTEIGLFGLNLSFKDGLNVLAAPNTSGKSTAVMSILYGLGLEGMLGSNQQPPLPDAMCRRVMHEGREIDITQSNVRMEIENHTKQRIVIERSVTGDTSHRQLIRGVLGPALSNPGGQYERRDFYVRTAGGAQAESGFHRYLAEFLGYDLPRIPVAETESIPLYLECLFPYFFVDQLTGWRDIKSRMPTYLRIPEMSKRSAEYVLDLDILHRAIEKQELQQKETQLKASWTKAVQSIRGGLAKYQVIVRGLPEEPVAAMPVEGVLQLFASDGIEWLPLAKRIEVLKARRETLVHEEIPRAEEVSQVVVSQLQEAQESLNEFNERLANATRDLKAEQSHRESIVKRLKALTEDYRRYQDAKKLQDRGGLVPLETSQGRCPTCHQPIKDVLLPQDKSASPMTLEENMAFIRDQLVIFREMLQDADGVLEAKQSQIEAIVERIKEINAAIRAQKKTLHADGRMPSASAIQENLLIDANLLDLEEASRRAGDLLKQIGELPQQWAAVQSRLKTLANVGLSTADDAKLDDLGKSFVGQLDVYRFESFPLDQLAISRETYRPAREGYDVGLTSASDTIRVIWAYLIGCLEVARVRKTNHIGFLLFDEPRQQGARHLSFDALLKRASQSGEHDQQVIFATSEEKAMLEATLKDLECHYQPFDGKMLTLLPAAKSSEPVVVVQDPIAKKLCSLLEELASVCEEGPTQQDSGYTYFGDPLFPGVIEAFAAAKQEFELSRKEKDRLPHLDDLERLAFAISGLSASIASEEIRMKRSAKTETEEMQGKCGEFLRVYDLFCKESIPLL